MFRIRIPERLSGSPQAFNGKVLGGELHSHKSLSKSVYNFSSNPVKRQTDRQMKRHLESAYFAKCLRFTFVIDIDWSKIKDTINLVLIH